MRIVGHATLGTADLSVAEAALPKAARWPRWLLVAVVVGSVLRVLLRDVDVGWTRALQIYFFSILTVLFAMLFGLGRWLAARPTPEQLMARLGLASNVLTVELDQEGLVYGAHGKRSWSEFRRFVEDETAFVLHGPDALLHVIPKRAFTLDALPRARVLMHACMPGAATSSCSGRG